MIFFAASFTTALQRAYLRAWRRPPSTGVGRYVRGAVCSRRAREHGRPGAAANAADGGLGSASSRVVAVAATTGLWWFAAWYLLLGDVRPRALLPTGVVTSVATGLYAVSATVWMPEVVEGNEEQFGFFGIGLSLVTWFSGAAICILIGACVGPVLAEDPGWLGAAIRGGDGDDAPRARRRLSRPGPRAHAPRRVPDHRRVVTANANRDPQEGNARCPAPLTSTDGRATPRRPPDPTAGGSGRSPRSASGRGRSSGFTVAMVIVVFVLGALSEIVLPMTFAAVLAICFKPLVGALQRRGLKPSLAAGLIVLGLLALAVGVFTATVEGRRRPGRPDQRAGRPGDREGRRGER